MVKHGIERSPGGQEGFRFGMARLCTSLPCPASIWVGVGDMHSYPWSMPQPGNDLLSINNAYRKHVYRPLNMISRRLQGWMAPVSMIALRVAFCWLGAHCIKCFTLLWSITLFWIGPLRGSVVPDRVSAVTAFGYGSWPPQFRARDQG